MLQQQYSAGDWLRWIPSSSSSTSWSRSSWGPPVVSCTWGRLARCVPSRLSLGASGRAGHIWSICTNDYGTTHQQGRRNNSCIRVKGLGAKTILYTYTTWIPLMLNWVHIHIHMSYTYFQTFQVTDWLHCHYDQQISTALTTIANDINQPTLPAPGGLPGRGTWKNPQHILPYLEKRSDLPIFLEGSMESISLTLPLGSWMGWLTTSRTLSLRKAKSYPTFSDSV